jgi:hypothetical protein
MRKGLFLRQKWRFSPKIRQLNARKNYQKPPINAKSLKRFGAYLVRNLYGNSIQKKYRKLLTQRLAMNYLYAGSEIPVGYSTKGKWHTQFLFWR